MTFLSKHIRIFSLLLLIAVPAGQVWAVGLILGQVENSDLSTPPNGSVLFFGFVQGTDSEIHLHTSIGAGYDNTFWFDDFRNYVSVSAGQPYDYFFFNPDNGEESSINSIIQSGDEVMVDIQLSPSSWPPSPENLTGNRTSPTSAQLIWSSRPGTTWHIYRRVATSDGSLFRIDNPVGDLSDPGVSDSSFVDNSLVDGIEYEYVVISEEGGGKYSPPSEIVMITTGESCCTGLTGNVNQDPEGQISVADIGVIVDYLFISNSPLPCPEAANTNGTPNGDVTVADIGILVDYLFITQTLPAPCP